MKTKTVWYFEVSVSKDGTTEAKADRYKRGDKVHWVRKGQPRDTFSECQADAIANGERPYRIKSQSVPVAEEVVAPAA